MLGYDPNGVDGIFGRRTRKAVKQLQRDNGLKVDGKVGKNTWAVINKLIPSSTINDNKNSYTKSYKIGTTQIIECTPDRINILEINKPLRYYTGGSGTFSWKGNSNGILINDGKIISRYSSHAWIGCPDGVLCYYKDGTIGIEEVMDAEKLSKPVIWAISGITLMGKTEKEFKKYGAKQGFKKFEVNDKKYNHTDVFRFTNHSSIGYRFEDGIYKVFYFRKPYCRRFRTVVSAKNLKLDGAIGLDSGHISAINIGKFKYNTKQKQNNIVSVKL